MERKDTLIMHADKFSERFSLRTVVVFLLIIGLLYAIFTAFRYGLADIKHYQLTSIINGWKKDHEQNDLNSWREAHIILQQVNELHPDNPYYLELLAKTNEWQGKHSRGAAAEIFYSEAFEALERSIKLRPVSPYTWLSIAKIKARLGEFDGVFSVAIKGAVKFGPWIESIQQGVAMIGFRYQEQIPEELKLLMTENLNRAVTIQKKNLFVLAEKYKATHLLCLLTDVEFSHCDI